LQGSYNTAAPTSRSHDAAFWCGAAHRPIWNVDQRVAGAAEGAGNGDPASAGAAAAFGFFGFGRIGFPTFGGGPAGLSSANTGLGSIVVLAGVVKSPV
jgi:hypothetical protein